MTTTTKAHWDTYGVSVKELKKLMEELKPVVRARIVVSKFAAPACNTELPTHINGKKVREERVFLLGVDSYKALMDMATMVDLPSYGTLTGVPISFEPEDWRP